MRSSIPDLPVRLALTAAEAHDKRVVERLLSRLKSGTMLLGCIQSEGRFYSIDDSRFLQAPICIKHELLRRLLVDDPTARPVVIFGPGDLGRQALTREARGTKCLPLLPTLVMTHGVREAIAVGLEILTRDDTRPSRN